VDFVINEIVRPEQQAAIHHLIDKGYLLVKSFSAESMGDLYYFNIECGGNLTITDSTVIYYALSLKECRLLTGDRQLRNRAEERGVTVSGILYVFDKLVEYGVIPSLEAAQKLEILCRINPRLPKREIDCRVARWKSGIIDY
ncbi:MAG: hypothetical protein ACI4C3_03600, partial [Bacteroides sp.]